MRAGIDYFPLDVYLDDKWKLLEAEFGLKGFAIIIKLLQKIYGECGYYCEWNEEVRLLFANSVGLAGSTLASEIVISALRREIFDSELYEKYQILTSKGIQKRYLEAVARRLTVEIKEEYLLLNATNLPKNVNILSKNVYINDKNVYISKQSRVKESRVKKSKVKVEGDTPPRPRFTKPTLEEVKGYCDERQNQINPNRFLDYYESKGWLIGKAAMKDWKAAVRNWEQRDNETKPKEETKSERKKYGEYI